MSLSKEAEESKPHKPLNTYMRFRDRELPKLGDDVKNKIKELNRLWKKLSDEEHDELKAEYKKDK